jgi:hypothetical protein
MPQNCGISRFMGLVLNALIGCVQRDLIRKDLDYGTVKNHPVAAGRFYAQSQVAAAGATPGSGKIVPPAKPKLELQRYV